MTKRFLLLLLLAALYNPSIFAQTQSADPKSASPATTHAGTVDLGQLDGVNYSNNFFGMSFSIPSTWVVVSAQRRSEIAEESKKLVSTEDQSKRSQLDDSIARSSTLLALTKLPAGEPGNASLMLIAERTPSAAFKSGTDVINSMKSTMDKTNFKVALQGDIQTERISGADFSVATFKTNTPYGEFLQRVFVTIRSDYALEFFLTYRDDNDAVVFDKVVRSVKLK